MSDHNKDKRTRARKRVSAPKASECEAQKTEPSGPDPTDLNSLWAPAPIVATKSQMMTIRASTRPPKDKFIQILPFDTGDGLDVSTFHNCRPVYLFEYTFDGDLTAKSYYVPPGTEVAETLADKERLTNALLVLGMVRHGSPFIWELKVPSGQNENADKWARSRLELAKIAQERWLKPVANIGGGGYDFIEPIASYDPPDWSTLDFDKAVEVACKDRVITDLDHDAVKEALGL